MQRQVKFIAKVVEVSTLSISFNDKVVFQGSVEITEDFESICEWTIDTSLYGRIPMKVTITQGEIIWADLHMNYSGTKLAFPGSQSLGHQRIKSKDYFSPPGSGELKLGVCINGELQTLNRQADELGAWHYTIKESQILECFYYIDRKRTLIFDVRN